ncbi:MAG: L,D-transpeptidase family protein [Cyclobacteriaceae bacterium]|nr:L,D-transpeptidase family protein [Cyclobacteriaceae bacterium]
MKVKLLLWLGVVFLSISTVYGQTSNFRDEQRKFSRVKVAYSEKTDWVTELLADNNLDRSKLELFVRVFKEERVLEVWGRSGNIPYKKLNEYAFCSFSGDLGPKRAEGDFQIPEGIYHINHFNPFSNFYLSMGINYPNKSDRLLGKKGAPGSNIYIHGGCATIGCIPITDDKIKELYLLAVEARHSGQQNIPVHIFPTRLDEEGIERLSGKYTDSNLIVFWKSLQPLYLSFEETFYLPKVRINSDGSYQLVE